jgi:hypothetical protein
MFRDIEADCYLITDGDYTYSAEDAPEMCRLVLEKNVDMVIGDRLSSTYFEENKRLFHNVGNLLVRKLINKIFRNNVRDIMTGYRAFSRTFVKNFPILSKGFEIETEMTIHALDKNFLLHEIAISYQDRPAGSVSKLNTYSDGYKVIMTIVRLFRDYKPLLFFSLCAIILLIIAFVLLIPVLINYLETGLVLRFPTLFVGGAIIIIAILLWICGLILDVIVTKHKQLYELLMNKNN